MKYLCVETTIVILSHLIFSETVNVDAMNCGISSPVYGDENSRSYLPVRSQAIVPTYVFACCGSVTRWRAYLQPGGSNHNNVYTIKFQVWRPSALPNSFYLESQTLSSPAILDREGQADIVSSISVQPGDVVGFVVTHESNDNGGIQLDTESHGDNIVWYAPLDETVTELQIGPTSTLTSLSHSMAAPIISINVSSAPCSTSDSIAVTPSTIEDGAKIKSTSAISAVAPTIILNESVTLEIISTDNEGVPQSNRHTIVAVLVTTMIVILIVIGTIVTLSFLIKRLMKSQRYKTIKMKNLSPTKNPTASTRRSRTSTENQYEYISTSFQPNQSAVYEDVDTCNTKPEPYENVGLQDDSQGINSSSVEQSLSNVKTVKIYKLDPEYMNHQYKESAQEVQEEDKHSAEDREVSQVPGYVVPNQKEREERPYDNVDATKYNKLDFFKHDQMYWTPADTTSMLYNQLAFKKYREIPKKEIVILEELGSGQYGMVSQAQWNMSTASLQIAIKELKSKASNDERIKLLQEGAIMGQFCHANVVKLYGLVTIGNSASLCLEYMSNGDLLSYLKKFKIQRFVPPNGLKDIRFFFVQATKNIASGMSYLSRKAFIHRDLAARNILMNERYICKIGDFGMSKDLMDDIYYASTRSTKIPIRWTAPEVLQYRKYSVASDVWSYGIVLYEIWSVGQKPYLNYSNKDVVRLVKGPFRLPPPPGCPRTVYKLMIDCWNPDYKHRPNFGEILTYLHQPVSKLLHGSTDFNHLPAEVADQGSPHDSAEMLHSDLQHKYKNEEYEPIYF